MVNGRNMCDMSVSEFCLENKTCLLVHLHILCVVCINLQYMKLCWIWQKCKDFTQVLTRTDGENNSNNHLHIEVVQMKFNMDTRHLDNHYQSFWQPINRSVQCVNSQLSCISAGQCLNFYDYIPPASILPTLNNPQDLDPDYLEVSFSGSMNSGIWEHR